MGVNDLMTTTRNKWTSRAAWVCLGLAATLWTGGCEGTDSTSATPPRSEIGAYWSTMDGREEYGPPPYKYAADANPGPAAGGAPSYGQPSGMGLYSGDSMHGAQGSGLMGYHGTGQAGTSSAITASYVEVAGYEEKIEAAPTTSR